MHKNIRLCFAKPNSVSFGEGVTSRKAVLNINTHGKSRKSTDIAKNKIKTFENPHYED